MGLKSTQLLSEMSTRYISGWIKAASAYGWQPYHLYVPTVSKSVILDLLETSGPVQACGRIAPLLHAKIRLKNVEFFSHTVSPSTKLAYSFFSHRTFSLRLLFKSDTPRLAQQLHSVRSGTSRNLRRSELSVHVVDYICFHKGVRLKSKLPNPAIRSVPTSPPCRLCYRPTVFFRHFRLIGLSFPQGKIHARC
jgi:hypothetical protein